MAAQAVVMYGYTARPRDHGATCPLPAGVIVLTPRSVAAEALFEQFLALPSLEQYAHAEEVLAQLRATTEFAETKRDAKLADQSTVLKALRTVAEALGLPDGEPPTSSQFRTHGPPLTGITIHQAIRAFKRWRWARDVYRGKRPAALHADRRLRRVENGGTITEALASVCAWLAEEPTRCTTTAYDAWVEQQNKQNPDGPRRLKRSRVCTLLELDWPLVLAVARGELSLAQAQQANEKLRRREREPDNHGPDDLIPVRVVAKMLGGVDIKTAQLRTQRPGFPPPALTTARLNLYRRDDIKQHLAGQELPVRHENELQHKYLETDEVAARFGIRRTSVKRSPHVPSAAMTISGFSFWLREDIEAVLEGALALTAGAVADTPAQQAA